MGLYARYVLPRIVNHVCGRSTHMRQREKLVPHAVGRVLEIGFGTGLNLPFYSRDSVSHIHALDPSAESWKIARKTVSESRIRTEFLEASAESIPLGSRSIDTIVITYSLCTIPDRSSAIGEMRRVLAEGGRLLFCEHGAAPDPGVRRWQRRINPVWTVFSGGCTLDVDVPGLLHEGGFVIEQLEAAYLSGFRAASFNYLGAAH